MNQNVGLLAMHTLFLREHNRCARKLAEVNPHWDDERLYQEARRINIAVFQKSVFKNWLPILISREMCVQYGIFGSVANPQLYPNPFYAYDDTINPQVANEFATAALRAGHSIVRISIPYLQLQIKLSIIINFIILVRWRNSQS